MKTILVDAVNAFVIKEEGINKEIHKMLDDFPNDKIILTNANDEEMDKFGLHNMPYELFTLEHEPNKTDSEYYKKMLEHFNLEAGDVVYFEHNPEAVKSAESVGIKTYHYDKETKPIRELSIFLEHNI